MTESAKPYTLPDDLTGVPLADLLAAYGHLLRSNALWLANSPQLAALQKARQLDRLQAERFRRITRHTPMPPIRRRATPPWLNPSPVPTGNMRRELQSLALADPERSARQRVEQARKAAA